MEMALGLLSGHLGENPGEHSLRLGTPGLNYAAPLGLVCGGVVGDGMVVPGLNGAMEVRMME